MSTQVTNSKAAADLLLSLYNALPAGDAKDAFAKGVEIGCNRYMESDEYKNGYNSDPANRVCCEIAALLCPMHTQGWFIFLCIFFTLIGIGGSLAAFWFFYIKRKGIM